LNKERWSGTERQLAVCSVIVVERTMATLRNAGDTERRAGLGYVVEIEMDNG
jgi:hypothetical protein